MMATKTLVVLCFFVATVLAGEKYTDKYDNIDLKEIMENKRLLLAYVNCVLDKGKCSPDGKELKDHLQEALETGCEKCTEAQQKGTSTMIKHLIEHEKELWDELCKKFDPSGKWRKEYEERAKAEGIVIPE